MCLPFHPYDGVSFGENISLEVLYHQKPAATCPPDNAKEGVYFMKRTISVFLSLLLILCLLPVTAAPKASAAISTEITEPYEGEIPVSMSVADVYLFHAIDSEDVWDDECESIIGKHYSYKKSSAAVTLTYEDGSTETHPLYSLLWSCQLYTNLELVIQDDQDGVALWEPGIHSATATLYALDGSTPYAAVSCEFTVHVCELTDIIGIEAEDYALEEYRFAYYCNGENEEPYVSYPGMSPEDLPITLRLSDGSAITETPSELYYHFNNPSTDSLFHYNTSKPDGEWQLGETIEATISLDIPIGSEEDEAFNELRCTCNITVVPSTVESVEIAPVELWELVDGMPCADENDQPSVYYSGRLQTQMCFTVRYKDGSVRTGLHWDELGFTLFSHYPLLVFPWGECGTYTGSLLAAGIECPYTVTVKENEVTALHANDQALRLSDCTHWAFRSDSSGELTVQKILNDLSDLLQFTVDLRDGTSFTGTAREISEKTGHWVGWIIDGEDGSDLTAPAPGTYHVVTFFGNMHFYGDSFDLTFYDGAFMDVPADAYYAAPVDWAVEQGVTTGTDATHFSPKRNCTRGELVTFLWRAAGKPEPTSTENPFTDVKTTDWYYKPVLWAVEKGITTGTGTNTFSPKRECTRGEVVTFLWRAAGKPEPTTTVNPFTDVEDSFYYKAVLWAVENGITTGTSKTTFAPKRVCTRGEVVTFLYRDRA